MALFPFILLRDKRMKTNNRLINHEKIHLRQQLELLILPFYIWYGIEYGILLIKLRDKKKAYYSISFEREAYANEADLNYLKTRLFWQFLNFIKQKNAVQ